MLFEGTCPTCLGVATITGNISFCTLCGEIILEEEETSEPSAPDLPPTLDIVSFKEDMSKNAASFQAQSISVPLDSRYKKQLPASEDGELEKFLAFAVEYFLGYTEAVEQLPDLGPPESPEEAELQPLSSHCYALTSLSERCGVPEGELLRRAVILYLNREEK